MEAELSACAHTDLVSFCNMLTQMNWYVLHTPQPNCVQAGGCDYLLYAQGTVPTRS